MNGMNAPNRYLDYLIEPSFQGVNRCFVLPFNALGDRAGHSRWKKKQLYGPFLWMGFNCLKARATLGRQFTFYY